MYIYIYIGAWWPNEEDIDLYPGAGQAREAFFLGFFAGITIETDDVILDLNGFTLKMDEKFYYSQPFFSIIELSSQPFLPQQGPGFFGSDPKFATNVVIKDGILGLSSHHGIHGNYNENIKIENVKIRNFQTHGIQLNGYNDIILENLEIGPSTNIAYLNGNYGQLRALLPTLRKLALKSTETIRFNGREDIEYTMQDLLEILEPLMVKAFNYAHAKAIENEEEIIKFQSDTDYDLIHDLFINPSGLSYGAVTYGIFLNYPSAGIFGWHVNDATSNGAVLNNIHIHDIYRKGDEIIGVAQRGRVYCNAFNGPLPLMEMLGDMDKVTEFADALLMDYAEDNENENENVVYAQYVGDIVTDVHIAMYEFGRDDFNNWAGIPYYGEKEGLLSWAKGENSKYLASDNNEILSVYCNNDAMFHPSKGLLGIKISGSENVELNGITIENLIDATNLGHDLCGEKDLYHFSQQIPYQIGFSMNMVHAMSVDFSDVIINDDIKINGIYSKTGLTFGISTWFDTKIDYKSSIIDITNVYAGYDLEDDNELSYDDRPNKSPEACAIRIFSSDAYQVENTFDDELNGEINNINIQCINGDVGCFGNVDGKYTNLGNIDDIQDENCQQVPTSLIERTEDNPKYSRKQNIFSPWDSHPLFFVLIAVILLICLFVSKRIYHDYPSKKMLTSNFEYDLVNTQDIDDDNYGTF